MKKVIVATAVRGFWVDLFNKCSGNIDFIYSENKQYEVPKKWREFMALAIASRFLKRKEYAEYNLNQLPFFYEEMITDARIIAKDFLFSRIGFFVTYNRFYFAELTFTPGGCMNDFDPEEYDFEWGKLLNLDAVYK